MTDRTYNKYYLVVRESTGNGGRRLRGTIEYDTFLDLLKGIVDASKDPFVAEIRYEKCECTERAVELTEEEEIAIQAVLSTLN